MIEAKSRDNFAREFSVSRETMDKLDEYASLIETTSASQNLIAQSTIPHFWDRHMFDSAQLLRLIERPDGTWLDVGSGAGFPGIVIALMTKLRYVLVEPRRLRAEFLNFAVHRLGLADRVDVVQKRVETVKELTVNVITARAFASLTETLKATRHLGNERTTWLLHKGRNAKSEVAEAQQAFAAEFDLFPSLTAPDAALVRVRQLPRLRP